MTTQRRVDFLTDITWAAAGVAMFFLGAFLAIAPGFLILEWLWTRNVDAENPPHWFPVLVYENTTNNDYAVVSYRNLADYTPVLDFDDAAIEEINQQLRAQVYGVNPEYDFLVVEESSDGTFQISLRAPTKGDRKTQGWYRIDNGQIFPERCILYGPGLAFMIPPFMLLGGAGTGFAFTMATRRFRGQPCTKLEALPWLR